MTYIELMAKANSRSNGRPVSENIAWIDRAVRERIEAQGICVDRLYTEVPEGQANEWLKRIKKRDGYFTTWLQEQPAQLRADHPLYGAGQRLYGYTQKNNLHWLISGPN